MLCFKSWRLVVREGLYPRPLSSWSPYFTWLLPSQTAGTQFCPPQPTMQQGSVLSGGEKCHCRVGECWQVVPVVLSWVASVKVGSVGWWHTPQLLQVPAQ